MAEKQEGIAASRIILIVDDEEPIIELICAIFDDPENYRTICAKDGHEALRIAREDIPDIVLLDICLPILDGYEVCRLIKSEPSMAHTKVLIMSSVAQKSEWLKAKEGGADDYISKPFTSVALIEKVKALLGND